MLLDNFDILNTRFFASLEITTNQRSLRLLLSDCYLVTAKTGAKYAELQQLTDH